MKDDNKINKNTIKLKTKKWNIQNKHENKHKK